eukprot:CAMPEP_0173099340 /NCGR_PEP_ID=MMETSP1102-20130122/35422_1 /TAXON_ID=49646 /ORGANISM="Geminigera sp., Strain Caron Lab Isolate" /LENGTH=89 /DNA_ID=CAMNT_0013992317 /DNA_START=68 /DNA_END=333 /DNA_ORIENTATION=-
MGVINSASAALWWPGDCDRVHSEPEEAEGAKSLWFEAQQAEECPRRAFLERSISSSVATRSGSVAWSKASFSGSFPQVWGMATLTQRLR